MMGGAAPNSRTVAVGLNPALQKTLFFDAFKPGAVNRAASVSIRGSGKGINFARASRGWGSDCEVFQFLGGHNGRLVSESLALDKIPNHSVMAEAETRVCSTCVCRASGVATELIEPSGVIAPQECDELLRQILARLPNAPAVALCGTFPPGVTIDFYAEILRRKPAGRLALLDAYKGVEALAGLPLDILKINVDELRELTGTEDVPIAARRCLELLGVATLALTDGPKRAWMFQHGGAAWTFSLPRLDHVVSPIGAGDTVSGVLVAELLAGHSPQEAFASALAAGSASCLTDIPAGFDLDQARQLRGLIAVETLPRP